MLCGWIQSAIMPYVPCVTCSMESHRTLFTTRSLDLPTCQLRCCCSLVVVIIITNYYAVAQRGSSITSYRTRCNNELISRTACVNTLTTVVCSMLHYPVTCGNQQYIEVTQLDGLSNNNDLVRSDKTAEMLR